MEKDDRRLITCIAMAIVGYLHHIFLIFYKMQFAAEYVEQLTLVADIMTILIIIGFIGMLWYGFVKGLVRKKTSESDP